jgi:Uma2 family endonuclease
MVASKKLLKLSPEEYLEVEKNSLIKHEYIQGKVYAMAGASDPHVTIAGNLFSLLRSHVRGSRCRVYISDMKASIESLNIFYYPDVMVTCEPRDREFTYFKKYPKLIIEVLSESTEAFDRGDKFADYRQLEMLEEYVLVSQTRMQVDCFRRNPDNLWVLYPYNKEDEVYFASLDFRYHIDVLYEDVSWP